MSDRKTEAICELIGRMASKYDTGVVVDSLTGARLDWGQAVARELLGAGWSGHPGIQEEPPSGTWKLIKDWDAGFMPDWMEPLCIPDSMKCGTCGKLFDPADLGNVFDHEHRGLPDVHGIKGEPRAS